MRFRDHAAPLVGIGCMRLSTDPDRDDAAAIDVLHAALDAGVGFLDTADAYCLDASEAGHNERLIARALDTWTGDRSRIVVATKGGLTRPQGNWIEDGRARHLVAACDASRRALGVDRIALYQLHAPDPRTPLSTSVRALASLEQDGLIDAIGLCNVTVGQIEEARRIVDIAAVQIELSVWDDAGILGGVAGYCIANGIRLIAHRPLGGPQRRRRTLTDPVLADLAARHGATPCEIALAWLVDLSPLVLPIPGPTRVETARSAARIRSIRLDGEDRARLDDRFPAGRALRPRRQAASPPFPARVDGERGEVVLIMGLPAAGKSTLAATFVDRGYARLNRDLAGGSLNGLLPELDRLLASGSTRVVVDNTYVSRKSRAGVIATAASRGIPVRCVWMSTTVEDAQVNAASRILARNGRLPTPDELKKAARRDPTAFGPSAQFRAQRELEPPDPSEGFASIEILPFERRRDPALVNRALIVWCDGILFRSRSGRRTPISPEDVEVLEGRGELLRRHQDEGWQVLGMSWQPEIAANVMTAAEADATLARMQELLGVRMDVAYCPHPAGPPTCWCRKPLPGLGVLFIERYKLDPSQSIYVGSGPQDPGFARRLGLQYRDEGEFFASLSETESPLKT